MCHVDGQLLGSQTVALSSATFNNQNPGLGAGQVHHRDKPLWFVAAARVSKTTVRRIWHADGLKPHLVKTFKVSNDVRFAEKLEVIVGRYLHPP